MNDDDLRSRFLGAILGLATADALAFPYKDHSRAYLEAVPAIIERGYLRHESNFFPAGQFTDDTQTALAVLDAVCEAGGVDGQTVVEHVSRLWRDRLVIDPEPGSSRAMERIVRGEADFAGSGCDESLGADVLARVVPLGLWSHGRSTLGDEVEVCARITHRDARVLAAAAGIAAAVAHNVTAEDIVLGTFLDAVSSAAGRFHGETAELVHDFPRILSMTEYRGLESLRGALDTRLGVRLPSFWDRAPDSGPFLFLVSLYYFLRSPFDLELGLSRALKAGGETTTLAGVTSALAGSFLGAAAIPEHLVCDLLHADAVRSRVDALFRSWTGRADT